MRVLPARAEADRNYPRRAFRFLRPFLPLMTAGLFFFSLFVAAALSLVAGGQSEVYSFGMKFEPPDGRVVHGMGQWLEDNASYLEMLADPSLYPLTELFFFDLEPTRPWDMTMDNLEKFLERQKEAGRIPNINLGLSGPNKESIPWWTYPSPPQFGVDHLVAGSNVYDGRLADIIQALKAYRRPVFFRIGGEFNGAWNGHHPYDYPRAFRKIVTMFKMAGADNTAFIWCYEPSAPNDFDEKNAAGEYKWFPGDDVIDWYSIDVFARRDFSDAYAEYERGIITPKGKSERFLQMALDHGRPVMIAESSVMDYDITSSQVWEEWFLPYFDLLADHPHIKAFTYVNADWPLYRPGDPFGWMDGRIHLNPEVSALYVEELKKLKYLHVDGAPLLKDYEKFAGKKARPRR